jgi:hypothetical protein
MVGRGMAQYGLEKKAKAFARKVHTEKISHVKIDVKVHTDLHFLLERKFPL